VRAKEWPPMRSVFSSGKPKRTRTHWSASTEPNARACTRAREASGPPDASVSLTKAATLSPPAFVEPDPDPDWAEPTSDPASDPDPQVEFAYTTPFTPEEALAEFPPKNFSLSSNNKRAPRSSKPSAVVNPAKPPPTIMASHSGSPTCSSAAASGLGDAADIAVVSGEEGSEFTRGPQGACAHEQKRLAQIYLARVAGQEIELWKAGFG
jgi:hypothetical protein